MAPVPGPVVESQSSRKFWFAVAWLDGSGIGNRSELGPELSRNCFKKFVESLLIWDEHWKKLLNFSIIAKITISGKPTAVDLRQFAKLYRQLQYDHGLLQCRLRLGTEEKKTATSLEKNYRLFSVPLVWPRLSCGESSQFREVSPVAKDPKNQQTTTLKAKVTSEQTFPRDGDLPFFFFFCWSSQLQLFCANLDTRAWRPKGRMTFAKVEILRLEVLKLITI